MTEFVAILRIGCASAFCLTFVGHFASAAQADAWDVFEARCLVPFEHQSFAENSGLEPEPSDVHIKRYSISDPSGEVLLLELENEPDDGLRACTISGQSPSALGNFETWIAEMVADERYVEVDEGRWQSNLWIEPVLEIQRSSTGDSLELRIVETELET